jgi:hypothetical protein
VTLSAEVVAREVACVAGRAVPQAVRSKAAEAMKALGLTASLTSALPDRLQGSPLRLKLGFGEHLAAPAAMKAMAGSTGQVWQLC